MRLKNIVTGHCYIPITICGNKGDVPSRVILPQNISLHITLGTSYYVISAKSNYNFEKPFQVLARKLTGHPDLEFD